MKIHFRASMLLLLCTWSAFSLGAEAQTPTQPPIQLFGPVNVRLSQTGASYSSPVVFNTNTLTLTCSNAPTATLSGTADGLGYILVDNNIFVTSSTKATTNVCTGEKGGQIDDGGAFPDCFTAAYQTPAAKGHLDGADVDSAFYPTTTITIVSTGGVPPIDISDFLTSGTQQLTIALEDEGGYVASSSVYLNTNCSLSGVQNGGTISGNTITPSSQTNQDFNFNPLTNQQIGFEYDLAGSYANQTVTSNASGAIPQVSDSGLAPSQFSSYVSGTSFATSRCLVHSGELVGGQPACKLYTLTCTTGTGSSAAGANCPVSSQPNEVLQDVFDGPSFTLADITTSQGTFHEGMGFLMAKEGWTGGPCTFDPTETDLASELCPQNLLTTFSGPGSFTSGGQTTHPNSTFISIYGVPEDLTTVTMTDGNGSPVTLGPGNWTNRPNPNFMLSSQPPNLTGISLPGATNFVAAPIQSISYGLSSANQVPAPGSTSGTDTKLLNPVGCPTPGSSSNSVAPVFAPEGVQPLALKNDGYYALHYYAQDCAGTQELKFVQDNSGSWTTNFYTYPINLDTGAPDATLALLPSGLSYYQGEIVTATYSCSDPPLTPSGAPGSGVITCGSQSFGTGVASAGPFTSPVNTSMGGAQSFTLNVADAAGNQAPQSVPYSVNIDSQIRFTLASNSIIYPLGTEADIQVLNTNGSVPTGNVIIIDNGNPVATLTLKRGSVYDYLSNLPAGKHSLNAEYRGDSSNPGGYSAAVQLTVLPVPVKLTASCWNTPYPYGSNFQCGVYASSNAGAPQGVINYSYDGGAPISLPLAAGTANIVIAKPPVGTHSLVISYPAQTNYAAAGPLSESFMVTPAPVNVQFTPSAWYLTGGNLTLTAAVASWSAGPPNATGMVTFSFGSTVLGGAAVPVNAAGTASITIPAMTLPNGTDLVTATYSNGANYASGSTAITLQVAVPTAP